MSAILKKTLNVSKLHKKVSNMARSSSTSTAQSSGKSSVLSDHKDDDTAVEMPEDTEEEEEEEQVAKQQNETEQFTSRVSDITKNPLDEVVTTAFGLGMLFGLGFVTAVFVQLKTCALYLMALALFHFLEYWVTAKYNPTKVHSESFIINNGSAYTLAHTFALIEFSLEYYLFPNFKRGHHFIKWIGFAMVIGGQFIRTLAMKTAGKSFNHLVQTRRNDDHDLVTSGIYYYFRHPSYFGFFWWAVGTQLMMLNIIGMIGFSIVLYSFFSERIGYEEKFLITFFGEKYAKYKKKTPVYIPFID
jgi:protein-S-isoprenylcysteine O-methyltransferase